MQPSVTRKPSALAPLAMSALALGVLVGYVVLHGTDPQPDEGAAAHTWQLLMAGQLPVIGYYAFRWLPENPSGARRMLLVQIALLVLNLGILRWLEW